MSISVEDLLASEVRRQAHLLADAFLQREPYRPGQLTNLLRHLVDCIPGSEEEERLTQKLTLEQLVQASKVGLEAYQSKRSLLKGNLAKYFREHPRGRMLPLALSLEYDSANPSVDCILRVVPNSHCLAMHRLWHPHLQLGVKRFPKATLIYTEPIVFWDEDLRCFVRFLDINVDLGDRRVVDKAIQRYLTQTQGTANPYAERLIAKKLTPAYHYESAGEVEGARKIGDCLSQLSLQLDGKQFFVERDISRNVSDRKVLDTSVVLFGNMRTNHLIATLQPGGEAASADLSEAPYSVGREEIEDGREPKKLYRDGVQQNGRYRGSSRVFCLITRWQTTAHATTILAANHGRAITAAADLLTDPEQAESIFHHPAFSGHLLAPRVFQLIVGSPFEDSLESSVGVAKIEDAWVRRDT